MKENKNRRSLKPKRVVDTMKKIALFLVLIAVLSGCDEQYSLLYFNSSNPQLMSVYEQDVLKVQENGILEIRDDQGKLLVTGEFSDGYKKGDWKYFAPDKDLDITWADIHGKNFWLEVPASWFVFKKPQQVFNCTLTLEDNLYEDNFFVVLKNNLEDVESLNNYVRFYVSDFLDKGDQWSDPKETKVYRLTNGDKDVYVFYGTKQGRDGRIKAVSGVFFQQEEEVYDMTLSSTQGVLDADQNQLLILEIFKSLRLNDARYFNPYDQWVIKRHVFL